MNLNFGQAIEHVKLGGRAARSGWNGKGMFIFLNPGSTDRTSQDQSHFDGVPGRLLQTGDTGTVTRLPNLNMKAASGATVTGWLASQTDILAEDWTLIL